MPKKNQIKFEKAIERLEEIVGQLESGSMDLDKSLEMFEEGIGLIRVCRERLAEVKGKIEVLTKKSGELLSEKAPGSE